MTYKIRYYTSYSGITLPLKLVGEIAADDMANRNTFFEGHFNDQDQLCLCRKIVSGETDLEHRYYYYDNGIIQRAIITEEDGEQTILMFDEKGQLSTQ